MKKSILILVSILSISKAFPQIYSVGNGDGFAFNSTGSVGNLIPLPIEILSLNSNCENGKATLNWSMPLQTEIDYYTIERTTDGTNYEIIATKSIDINNSLMDNFTFTDDKYLNGTMHYRLKFYGFNGKVYHLVNRTVKCGVIPEINIYPNPSTGFIYIDGLAQNSQVIIKDILGQVVFHNYLSEQKTTIDLNSRKNGVYIIEVVSETETISKKIIVNK